MEKKDVLLIEKLRKRSNASVIECKKAFDENNGNLEDTIKFLKNKGYTVSESPIDRISGILSIIGFVLFVIYAIAPGVVNVLTPPELNTLSLLQWLMITIIGGAVSMLMMIRSLAWIIGGTVTCAASFLLFRVYFNIIFDTRETFIKIEFAIPVLLALGIGIAITVILEKLFQAGKTKE